MLTKERVWEKWLPGAGADANGLVPAVEVDVVLGTVLVVVDFALDELEELEPHAAAKTASEKTSARERMREARVMGLLCREEPIDGSDRCPEEGTACTRREIASRAESGGVSRMSRLTCRRRRVVSVP